MSIHQSLVSTIRRLNSTVPSASGVGLSAMSDEEIIRLMFSNFRGGNEGLEKGLKLSAVGLDIMRTYFQSWTVVFPDTPLLTPYHVLMLDRGCAMPWYVSYYLPISVTFFEPDLAMRAKLVGDLDVFFTAFES